MVCQSKGYSDSIKFDNEIILDKEINKGYQSLHYKVKQWKVKGIFDILGDTSKNVTLVKLMDTVGNMNHAVNIVEKWIYS